MHYRKPKILMPLVIVVGVAMTFSAVADSLTDDNGTYFKGPMATCLSRAKVVYPCVSFSPPAYQANSAFVNNVPLGSDLPLDADKHQSQGSWIAKLMDSGFWSPKGLFSSDPQGKDMNYGMDPSGVGMKMNLGPMKLNMYVDEAHFNESQFFLGIDRSW
jgi:hypothetical protein